MTHEKKPSFLSAQRDGWIAKALYDFSKFALGAALFSLFGSVALGKPLKIIGYAFGCLIGLYFMVSTLLNRKNQAGYDPRLAAALLRVDAEAILQRYKQLDFDHREDARLPLNSASWPNYGSPWDYVDASLAIHAQMMKVLIIKARVFWMQMEYKDEPLLFSLNDSSRLDQVIDALDDFKQRTLIFQGKD